MFVVKKRLGQVREVMRQKQIDAYLIPTADFHQSEYVGDYFQTRRYVSGFTGYAGTLIITLEQAGLWTDGRYFIQAEQELEDSEITLYKSGVEGMLTEEEFLQREVKEHGVIGFDGRTVAASVGKRIEEMQKEKGIRIAYEEDLIDLIWEGRPVMSMNPVYVLELRYAGEDAQEKIKRIREAMEVRHATMHIITSLDDIAWILNIRGSDIPNNPVVLCYLIITKKESLLFIEELKLSWEVTEYLEGLGITIYGYNEIYEYVKMIVQPEVVLCDLDKVNYAIIKAIPSQISIINGCNPSVAMRAVKNEIEIDNLRQAHIKDGVAFTKFMYYIKQNIGKVPLDEVSASEYLEEQRKQQNGYLEPSFSTICAYKENAAMMHYHAKKGECKELKKEGLLLIDSGGQYLEGTTDLTRTLALGPVCEEQRKHYTAVVVSMLNLSNARFLYGCTGQNLDILARGPIWNMNLDYQCGTGHGVGYLLNVHEGPNGFCWSSPKGTKPSAVLEDGMVTTDEPGIYIEGSHGIRIENELVCCKGEQNEYGQFMYFEPLTMAPIDVDALDMTRMTTVEKARLNAYHKKVYETILPFLTLDEAVWLRQYTRQI